MTGKIKLFATPLFTALFTLLMFADRAHADIIIDLGRGAITVHVPASYDPAVPAPMIMLLHGYGSNGNGLLRWLDIEALSD